MIAGAYTATVGRCTQCRCSLFNRCLGFLREHSCVLEIPLDSIYMDARCSSGSNSCTAMSTESPTHKHGGPSALPKSSFRAIAAIMYVFHRQRHELIKPVFVAGPQANCWCLTMRKELAIIMEGGIGKMQVGWQSNLNAYLHDSRLHFLSPTLYA